MSEQPNPNPNPELEPTPPLEGTPPEPEPTDLVTLRRELDRARKEAAGYRTKANQLESEQQVAKDAQLSEVDRLKKEKADLEARIVDGEKLAQARELRAATILYASKLGYADPEDAHRMLNASDVTFDGDGSPSNIETLLKDMLKAKPYLGRKGGSADAGGGGEAPEKVDMNARLRQAAGR